MAEYTPSEADVRAWCREGTGDYPDVMDEWITRFLARVRRDALAAAEHRATRAEAQAAIRGRAVVIYRERAREAEARVRDLAQEVKDERGACLDQMEQVRIRDARIRHLEDTARVLVKEVLTAEDARDEHRRGKAAAEARIQAVRDVLDEYGDPEIWAEDIRRALDGDA